MEEKVFADVIKVLEMRLSWINVNDGYPYKRYNRRTDTEIQRKGHVNMEMEAGVLHEQTEEHQGLPAVSRR